MAHSVQHAPYSGATDVKCSWQLCTCCVPEPMHYLPELFFATVAVMLSWMCTGGTPFVYQSCTHQQQPRGSMEGFFKFVEGTARHPTGPAFDVEASLVLTA